MKKYYLKDILSMKSYMSVNKFIASTIGVNEAIIFAEIERLYNHYYKKNELTPYFYTEGENEGKLRGHFFWSTYDRFVDSTKLKKHAVVRALKHLKELNLIDSFEDNLYIPAIAHVGKVKFYTINKDEREKLLGKKTGYVADTYNPDEFILFNRLIAKHFGPLVAVLLNDLYDSYEEALNKGQLEHHEYFRFAIVSQAKNLGVTRETMQKKYIPILEKAGIIEFIQIGFPRTTYIKINEDPIFNLFEISPIDALSFKEKQAQRRIDNQNMDNIIKFTKELCSLAQSLLKTNYSDLISRWEYNENILSYIKGRLENNSPETLKRVMEYKFNTWDKPGKDFMKKYFTVSGLYTASALKQHLIEIGREDNEKELEVKAYDILEKIMSSIKELDTKKLVKDMFFTMKSYKVDYIRYCLKEGFSEEDIIAHAVNRYNYYTDNYPEKDITTRYTFNSLYDVNGRKKIKEWTNNDKKKSYKTDNSKTKDNVKSKSYTPEEIAEIKRKAQTGEEEVY